MAAELPSKKQRALLEFIDGFIRENNYAPSYREIMRALEYRSVSTVAKHVDGLIARGWLVKRDNAARSLAVRFGQGAATADSPAPVPSAGHEEWLRDVVAKKVGDDPPDDATRRAIAVTLGYLGLERLLL